MEKESNIDNIRHSLAHLLAMAVTENDPKAKLAIGPTIENGFYYDFELSEHIGVEDLPKLEKKIKNYIKQKIEFKKIKD